MGQGRDGNDERVEEETEGDETDDAGDNFVDEEVVGGA